MFAPSSRGHGWRSQSMPFALGSFFMLVLLSASGLLSIGNKDPSSNSGSRYDKGPFEPIPSQHDMLRTAGTVDPDTRVTSPVVSPPLRGLVEKIEARPAPVSSASKTVSDDVVVALPRRPIGEESRTTTSSGGDRPIRPERALYIPDILDPTRFSLTRTLTDESLQRFDLSRLVLTTKGEIGETAFRMYYSYLQDGKTLQVSPWHDIPLYRSTAPAAPRQPSPMSPSESKPLDGAKTPPIRADNDDSKHASNAIVNDPKADWAAPSYSSVASEESSLHTTGSEATRSASIAGTDTSQPVKGKVKAAVTRVSQQPIDETNASPSAAVTSNPGAATRPKVTTGSKQVRVAESRDSSPQQESSGSSLTERGSTWDFVDADLADSLTDYSISTRSAAAPVEVPVTNSGPASSNVAGPAGSTAAIDAPIPPTPVPTNRFASSINPPQLHCHFVCEIPRWTVYKQEIAKEEEGNPVAQVVNTDGTLRKYPFVGSVMFNYGCLPQTYEAPQVVFADTGVGGDGDPLDVLELGAKPCARGQVMVIKILGVLGLVDANQTDWKVLAISLDDPLAPKLNTISDVTTHIPGAVEAIRESLRTSKRALTGEDNRFALDERAMPIEYAASVIEQAHRHWKGLFPSVSAPVAVPAATVPVAPAANTAPVVGSVAAEPLNSAIDTVHEPPMPAPSIGEADGLD